MINFWCNIESRRDAGVVDLACLENKCAFTRTGGSNPPLSAKIKYDHLVVFYLAWGSEPPGFAAGKTTAGFGEAKKGSESLLSTLFERRSEAISPFSGEAQ